MIFKLTIQYNDMDNNHPSNALPDKNKALPGQIGSNLCKIPKSRNRSID